MTNFLGTDDWLKSLLPYKTLWLGFSGGLDSTVLLHLLATSPLIKEKVQAIHVHHGLSSRADEWLRHCQAICESLAVPLIVQRVSVDSSANVEEGARMARYQVFSNWVRNDDCLLLAHHRDDQAETLLLQLFRGAGVDGLAAMASVNSFATGMLRRPLLGVSRADLENYALLHQLSFVDDESNQDIDYSRNFLRHDVFPLLRTKWPQVVKNLVRTVAHCQEAKKNLEALAAIDYPGLDAQGNRLSVAPLKNLAIERLANVLRVWFKINHVKLPSSSILNRIIQEVILANEDAEPLVCWGYNQLRRFHQTLYLLRNEQFIPSASCIAWLMLERPLMIGHQDEKPVYVTLSTAGINYLKDRRVDVRFRQGGELLVLHQQTKQLKTLFQEWQVPPWSRSAIPLLYVEDKLEAVIGFAVSDDFYRGCLDANPLTITSVES